jgi:hypothetical protein
MAHSSSPTSLALLLVIAIISVIFGAAQAAPVVIAAERKPHRNLSVKLGTAGNFAILSKAGVSTVPSSAITGDVGVSPIAQGALTGFSKSLHSTGTFATSSQVTGNMYAADLSIPTPAKLTAAISDMQLAYDDAAGRVDPDHINFNTGALGGTTPAPGLYKFSTGVGFTDDCILTGTADDTWIFQVAGASPKY